MKAFSIVCIVVGSFTLIGFVAATEPPALTLEETAGLGVITALFLIALGIVGVVSANKATVRASTNYASRAMPAPNIPAQSPTTGYCVSCGNPLPVGAAFCSACGKPA